MVSTLSAKSCMVTLSVWLQNLCAVEGLATLPTPVAGVSSPLGTGETSQHHLGSLFISKSLDKFMLGNQDDCLTFSRYQGVISASLEGLT